MRSTILFICIFLPFFHAAQNVGVGTTTPAEKLEVKNALRSTVKISSNAFNDTTELLLSNRTNGNAGTDFSIKSVREEGLFLSSLSDLSGNVSPNSIVIRPNGFVGLNDPASSARLTVRGNETTGDGQAAAIKIQNTAASNSWYIRSGATGTNTPANGFSIADNGGYHFNMAQGGNIGLGIAPTAARLHVNGEIRMQGTNVFEFGAGVAGKEANAGKVGYNAFGQNAMVFVGGGTSSSNRAFYFYGEGGTTFNGPLNIEGALRLNNNPGSSGQVLTSNGAADPAWTNSAFSNTTRFAASIPRTFEPNPLVYSTIYNLNPTDVTISSSTITINKSGLYHFEGVLEVEATFTVQAPAYISLNSSFVADGNSYDISNYGIMDYDNLSPTQWVYRKTLRFENEIYISAPATVSVGRSINFNTGGASLLSRATAITISGYLISE